MSFRRTWRRTNAPSASTAVPAKRQTKRALFSRHLAETRPERLTEDGVRLLREKLAPISEPYLRELLRSCGLPLDPVVEGVRQESFEELERTLVALARQHDQALESGDKELAAACRRAVLTGKDHARLASRRAGLRPEDRARKEEMASWMLVWVENPAIFPDWVALRKRV
jgi:hypothetical protein